MTTKKSTRKTKDEEVVDATVVSAEGESPDVEIEPVRLTINDLGAIATILDVAVQRGAYKAGELSQVGAVYDRLSAFLQQVQAAEAAEKAEAGDDAGETEA